ncbi:hypothetical protein ACEN2J_15935 [Pseudorhodobacter sp. W20_MBD10_FR17]|jgi:hypothetical protein|uniref:hypothetical protein n=1 Tax=Pseudorhodobacter sp. W20_MBD10_FR17 TaxID=3240266 RepID=UPI003F9B5281
MRKMVQRAANYICKRKIDRLLPGVMDDLQEYGKKSGTTGTQFITLWMSINAIQKYHPNWILESGTGSSTLVLAALVKKLRKEHPDYQGNIVSMESVPEWFDVATKNLPEKYRDVVEIVLGPRQKFEMAMYRGYIHSNIPKHDYSFVLIDGPAFTDESGVAFCADIFHAMDISSAPVMHGVSDGRASTVMVIQHLYGVSAARYWHGLFAARFSLPRIDFRNPDFITPKDFATSLLGRLDFVKFRR